MKTVRAIGVSETTADRLVSGILMFPESIGLHDDRPALETAIRENLATRLPNGEQLRGELAIEIQRFDS